MNTEVIQFTSTPPRDEMDTQKRPRTTARKPQRSRTSQNRAPRRKGRYVIVHGILNNSTRRFDDLSSWRDDEGRLHLQLPEGCPDDVGISRWMSDEESDGEQEEPADQIPTERPPRPCDRCKAPTLPVLSSETDSLRVEAAELYTCPSCGNKCDGNSQCMCSPNEEL